MTCVSSCRPAPRSFQVRREAGRPFGILERAQDVNEQMPKYVAGQVGAILNDRGRSVSGALILVLGVTYKADVTVLPTPHSAYDLEAIARGSVVVFDTATPTAAVALRTQ